MSLLSWVRPSREPMPPKDPMDWRLTKNSQAWYVDNYCPHCKASTTHMERMSRVCNNCGGHTATISEMLKYRANRKIWDGGKWVLQRKYGNGPNDFTLEDCDQ